MYATYIINVLPIKFLGWKSTHEKFYNNALDYSRFQVFGSLCFYEVLPTHDKLAPRSHKSIFLIFSLGQKGLKLYDLNIRKVIVSRNVQFFSNFPYKRVESMRKCEVTPDIKTQKDVPTKLRRSNKITGQPTWLKDYVTNLEISEQCSFLSKIVQIKEPCNYYEAAKDPLWVEAMQRELDALEEKYTRELCTL